MRKPRIALLLAATGLALTIACAPDAKSPDSNSKAAAAPAPSAATPAMIERGRAIYAKNCTPCHGETGKGDGPGAGVLKPPPRDHTDYAYMSALADKEIADVIKMGGAIKGRPLMPSHPAIVGADMDGLVAYIRTLSVKP